VDAYLAGRFTLPQRKRAGLTAEEAAVMRFLGERMKPKRPAKGAAAAAQVAAPL
jgi:hypothetical protein